MLVPLVAVLLAAEPAAADPPAAPPEQAGNDQGVVGPYAPEPPVMPDAAREHSIVRGARFGGGVARVMRVSGVAPAFDVGIELGLGPDALALRLEFQGALRFGWGIVGGAPDLVVYLAPRSWWASPYLAGGVQLGAANFSADSIAGRALEPAALRVARGAMSSTPPPVSADQGSAGPSPLRFTWGPQATAGVLLQSRGGVGLDLGARYTSVTWDGKRYDGVSLVVMIVAPP
jgi:hypothetical protein